MNGVLPHIWNNVFGSNLQDQLEADDQLYVSHKRREEIAFQTTIVYFHNN